MKDYASFGRTYAWQDPDRTWRVYRRRANCLDRFRVATLGPCSQAAAQKVCEALHRSRIGALDRWGGARMPDA